MLKNCIPKQSQFVTEGYHDYRKRSKKKHSKKAFYQFVKAAFKEHEIDISLVSSGPYIFAEILWQCQTLIDWCFELTKLLAIRDGEGIEHRRKHLEMIKAFQEAANTSHQILTGDTHASQMDVQHGKGSTPRRRGKRSSRRSTD